MQSSLEGLWGLSHAHAAALAAHCKASSARRGEVIVSRGAQLPGVLVLSAGTVKLSLRSAEGEERVLRIVAAGDAFGEPTAMLGKPCLYDALALAARSYAVLAEFEAATTQRGAQRLAGYLESLQKTNVARGATVQLPVSK